MTEQTFTIKRRPGWGQDIVVAGVSTMREAVEKAARDGSNLRGSDLSDSDLRGSDLRGSDLRGSDLRGSNLRGSDLSDSDLRGSDLSGSDLRGSDLRGSDLRGSDLRGSDLRGSDLSDSDLRGSDLRGSDLTGAVVHGEKITRILASANRLDGYTFFAFELEAGGVKIMAGCRWFTVAEYRAHVAAEYPDTDKAAETLDLLAFIEARAKSLGVALETEAA